MSTVRDLSVEEVDIKPQQYPISPRPTICTEIVDEQQRIEKTMQMLDQLAESYSAVEVQVILKNLEDIVKKALAINVEKCLLKMDGKQEDAFGAHLVIKSSKSYEYVDGTIDHLEQEIDKLKGQLKDRKKFLESLKSNSIDEATGEVSIPAKLVKDGCSLAITLKK